MTQELNQLSLKIRILSKCATNIHVYMVTQNGLSKTYLQQIQWPEDLASQMALVSQKSQNTFDQATF